MRAFIIVMSFVLCIVCLFAIPATLPAFADAFGVVGALAGGMALGTAAIIMAVQCVTFGADAISEQG